MTTNWKEAAAKVFQAITPIPPEEWKRAEEFLSLRTYKKGEHLLEAGEVAAHSFLLLKGIVRIYYLTEAGREYNSGFASEGHFCGSVSSIIGNLPSPFFIQALEDVEAVLLSRKGILDCYDRHRAWDRFGRMIAEQVMMFMELKEAKRLDQLEERYLDLIRTQPDLPERVPQYQIASYLGITHVALSRLRKKIRDRDGGTGQKMKRAPGKTKKLERLT